MPRQRDKVHKTSKQRNIPRKNYRENMTAKNTLNQISQKLTKHLHQKKYIKTYTPSQWKQDQNR